MIKNINKLTYAGIGAIGLAAFFELCLYDGKLLLPLRLFF